MKKCLVLIIISFLLTSSLFSQDKSDSIPSASSQNTSQREKSRVPPQSRSFFPFKAKRTKDQEKRLKPSEEDQARFSDFLKQSKTGIIRLVNDKECESNVYVIRVDENCQNTIPGGSFYSFREKEYTTIYLSDLRLKDGLLITDGILSQNILVRLGDVPLENLSVDSVGMKYLTDFVPEVMSSQATKQYIEIVKGIRADKYEYRKVIPALEQNTYALRIIAYHGNVYRSFRGWFFNLLDGDKRIDLIVGFRIVRKEKDGNITILWKELTRKKSPKLKNDKKKEIKSKPIELSSNRTLGVN